MRPLKCGLACVVLLGGMCALLPAAFAQTQTDSVTIGVNESRRVNTSAEPDPEGVGIPYSQVLRDTRPPYEKLFSDIKLGARQETKVGSGGAKFDAHFFNGPGLNIPLVSPGGAPRHSVLKIGRFYLDIRSISAAVLYSDNVNLTTTDARDGAIAIVRMGLIGIFQLTDNVRLSLAGTLIYLPFRNRIGIAGFGIDDAFADLADTPLARAQLTYNLEVGRWDVQAFDYFEARHRRIGLETDFDFFNGVAFPEQDRAGRYVFGDGTVLPPARGGRFEGDGTINSSLIELRNIVGFSAGRVLPTVTHVELGANHTTYWYHGNTGLVPNSRDAVYAIAQSERENLRFKPYASYRADRYNYDPNWNHEVRGGIAGPVTGNIDVLGEGGYFWSDNRLRSTTIWRGRIRHTIGPFTYHQFEYFRTVTEPVRDLEESYRYQIRQILGPYLFGEAYALRSTFEPLDRTDAGSLEDRFGARLTSDLGLRTTARAGFAYSHIEIRNPAADHADAWRMRFELRYRHTEDLQWLLTYQYQTVTSSRSRGTYEENLVILSVTKYF